MSKKVDALEPVETDYSEKLGAVIGSSSAFVETGYNFLSDQRSMSRAKDFEKVLRKAFEKQGIPVSSKAEFNALAVEVLNRIATQWNLPRATEFPPGNKLPIPVMKPLQLKK